MRPILKPAVALFSLALAASSLYVFTESPALAQRGGRGTGAAGTPATMFKARITPNWFAGNSKFWYRNDLRGGAKEFILVDAVAGTRVPAFDHEKLAGALAKVAGSQVSASQLPFDAIEFVDDGKAVRFTVGSTSYKCTLDTYEVSASPGSSVTGAEADFTHDLRNPEPAQVLLADASPESDALDATEDAYAAFSSPAAGGAGAGAARGGGAGAAAGGGGGRGGRGAGRGAGGGGGGAAGGPIISPDGKYSAAVRSYNIFLTVDGKETQLTQDGSDANFYTRLAWSRDSQGLIAYREQPGIHLPVYRLQSSPPSQSGAIGGGVGREVLQTTDYYALAGDKFDTYELSVFNPATAKQSKPDIGLIDMSAGGGDPQAPNPQWLTDGYHFRFEKYDRGHQRYRLIEIDAHSGTARNIIDDKTDTFIWSAHRDGLNLPNPANTNQPRTFNLLNRLTNSDQYIYVSEMDGWRHLYMVDGKDGTSKKITTGDWPVRFVDLIDEQTHTIWFMANGVYPGQDPLFMHYGHINFDGTGLVWMTDGNGMHSVTYSPDYKYIIDTYSRVDMAPVNELRRVSDGKLIVALEKAEYDAATANPLEAFSAKGRDGTTDIWGTITRPRNFDPTKKYPIIENIYAGPQGSPSGSFVSKTFALNPAMSDQSLLNLGFIVVHIDGMGTPGRSKAFHDVCWHNLADAGFPDRIAWIKAAAAKYPSLDDSRVGIFGTSAGGQNAGGALLFHGDFYKVGVANSGCHDNRMDKASWNEQWMGYPVGANYSACSNIDNAYRLTGHLQLVVGELDTNVPPESTFRMVDALIKARRDFEFVMVPGADHGAASNITETKRNDFFVRYLQGTEPANHNTTPGSPPTAGGVGRGRGRGGA